MLRTSKEADLERRRRSPTMLASAVAAAIAVGEEGDALTPDTVAMAPSGSPA